MTETVNTDDISTYHFHLDPDAMAEVTVALREQAAKLSTTQRNDPADAAVEELGRIADALDRFTQKAVDHDTRTADTTA